MDKLFVAQQALLNKQIKKQVIVSFHQDSDQQWLAKLKCSHVQQVRHQPPFINRPWVMSQEGRTAMLGCLLACKKCGRH